MNTRKSITPNGINLVRIPPVIPICFNKNKRPYDNDTWSRNSDARLIIRFILTPDFSSSVFVLWTDVTQARHLHHGEHRVHRDFKEFSLWWNCVRWVMKIDEWYWTAVTRLSQPCRKFVAESKLPGLEGTSRQSPQNFPSFLKPLCPSPALRAGASVVSFVVKLFFRLFSTAR